MPFDPDAYLADSGDGFDPDAYLKESEPEKPGVLDRLRMAPAELLRKVAPGLVSTFAPKSPERAAERQAFADMDANLLTEPGASPDAYFDAAMRSGLLNNVLAPMSGAPRVNVRPPRLATNPAAQTLKAHGIKNLTTGQRAPPGSVPAILERVSADHPLGLRANRDAAKDAFMRAAQDKGVAPGAKPPTNPDVQGRLGELFEGFEAPYGQIKGKPIDPSVVASLPEAAAMPRRGVDARTAAAVKAEVENALSVLGPEFTPKPAHVHGAAPAKPQGLVDQFGAPIPPAPKPPPKATAGDLLKVRENIRENIRAARQAQDFDRLRLLDDAEDVVTDALEKSLSPQEAQLLRQTDRQYARLMTATNAAPAGQTDFTPGQYLRQVEKSAGRRAFKKGEAGDLQELGEAARDTFTEAPMTGFRPGVLSTMPGAKYWGAPVSRLLNTDAGKRFLFEPRKSYQRPPETFIGTMGGAAQLSPDLAALAQFLRSKGIDVRLPVGTAEEDRP